MIGVAHDGALRIVVPSMGKHSLRVMVAVDGCSHTEVTEHCVGLPAADELGGFAVDSSTQQCSGWLRRRKVSTQIVMFWFLIGIFVGFCSWIHFGLLQSGCVLFVNVMLIVLFCLFLLRFVLCFVVASPRSFAGSFGI